MLQEIAGFAVGRRPLTGLLIALSFAVATVGALGEPASNSGPASTSPPISRR